MYSHSGVSWIDVVELRAEGFSSVDDERRNSRYDAEFEFNGNARWATESLFKSKRPSIVASEWSLRENTRRKNISRHRTAHCLTSIPLLEFTQRNSGCKIVAWNQWLYNCRPCCWIVTARLIVWWSWKHTISAVQQAAVRRTCVSCTQAPYICLVKSRLVAIFESGIDDVIAFSICCRQSAAAVQSRNKAITSIHQVECVTAIGLQKLYNSRTTWNIVVRFHVHASKRLLFGVIY